MKKKDMTWLELLQACNKYGKDNVLATLEPIQRMYEGMSYASYEEGWEGYDKGGKYGAIALKQLETIVRLKNMTQEEIDEIVLKESKK